MNRRRSINRSAFGASKAEALRSEARERLRRERLERKRALAEALRTQREQSGGQ